MQPGSIGAASSSAQQQQQIAAQKAAERKAVELTDRDQEALPSAPRPEVEPEPPVPQEKVTLAARFQVAADALQAKDAGPDGSHSDMTIALVPQNDQAELEKRGVVFPDLEEVRSNEGLMSDGRLEIVPVNGTGNPNTTHILQTLEVDRSFIEKDANGKAPIDDYIAQLIEKGSTVVPAGYFAVPEGSQVAPQGFQFSLATSKKGAKLENRRLSLNSMAAGLVDNQMFQMSLAGIGPFPFVSQAAALVALPAAGFVANKHLTAMKEAEDQLAYVEQREKLSDSDMITLESDRLPTFQVSAQAEKERLSTSLRTAQSKLLSSSLIGASGLTTVLGWAAAGGAVSGGAAGILTVAAAATPYLAGAGMVVGSGGMVLNSLSKLKSLSQEKAELQGMLDKGETHVAKTIERVHGELGRNIAIGQQQVPIEERLKAIKGEQATHRLVATASGGFMASMVSVVGIGTSMMATGAVTAAPAGLLLAGQSISKLKELSSEKKELLDLHKSGATLTPKQTERQDGSWGEEKIPISVLLSDIATQQKKHKLILTAVGSVGALAGMTLGAGIALAAAAPVLLIPAILGAAMFPGKVKEFAGKVADFVSGRFGDEGKSRKALVKDAKEQVAQTKELLINDLDPLAEADPDLFYVPTKQDYKIAKAKNEPPKVGYFTQLNSLLDSYSESGSRETRFQVMTEIEGLLAQAPVSAKDYMGKVREHLTNLHTTTEIDWVARDVALELKSETTEKILSDDRVKSRVREFGFSTDNLKEQYKESLDLQNSEKKYSEMFEKSQAGDRDASLELARREVFSSARLIYKNQEELGPELFARLVDVLQQSDKAENVELVIKEVNHKLGRPMAPAQAGSGEKWWLEESTVASNSGLNEPLRLVDFQGLAQAVATLERSYDISGADAPMVGNSGKNLDGPQARMSQAFRELHSVDAEAAQQLGKAFAALNDPQATEGLSPSEGLQAKMSASLELTKAKAKLSAKAPELMQLWDSARQDVEEEYFQRSIDPEFMNQVLARPELAEASERLGVSAADVKSLYLGLLRSEVMGDASHLQRQIVDSTGQDVDPAKGEILQVLDRTIAATAANELKGANDTIVPSGVLGKPAGDPAIKTFLEKNPGIEELLDSEQLEAAAQQMQVTPQEAREAYLTLVQANINPLMTAEFDGLYSGGDVRTVRTFQIGSRVGELVKASVTPSVEAVNQQVDAAMAGPVVASILEHPEIKSLAENLKVDAEALMRKLLRADMTGDKAALETLAQKAKHEDAAKAELEMIQVLAQATLQATGQLQAPQQQAA